jgi:hypothetical protein
MVGHHELVKPLSDLSEMVSCKDISVVISRVPYIRQNDWGRAVELFEVIKADFTVHHSSLNSGPYAFNVEKPLWPSERRSHAGRAYYA